LDIVVKAEDLKKVYKTEYEEVEALKGVNLEIKRAEMVAIMGPSGSGKSTLLHLLGGIDKPTEGYVYIDGKNIFKMKDNELAKFRNKNIGFVFQFHYLLPEFTALENVMIPSQFYKYKREEEIRERAVELLTELNLKHRLDHKPSQLSGGEQQRVAIARAIINEPLLIIADEPTGNLDSGNARIVMDIFKRLNKQKGVSIIIATHDEFVASYCHRIIKMKDGIIIDT
jgi:lipoprotein releasing system ATP-binding protein